jgi:hypothetical protein
LNNEEKMRKARVGMILLGAVLASTGGAALASPVLYASSTTDDSSAAPQIYVIDPVAATITALRGLGAGSAGGGGFSGGGGIGGTSGGGDLGGTGGAGGSLGGSGVSADGQSGPVAMTSPTDSTKEPSAICDPLAPSLPLMPDCSSAPALSGTHIVVASPLPSTSRLPPGPGPEQLLPPLNECFDCSGPGPGGPDGPQFTPANDNPGGASSISLQQIPEPGSLVLLGAALAAFGMTLRRTAR